MKFTAHERVLANTTSADDDLDYMHARFYSPQTGRFLSFDPKVLREPTKRPQRSNKYTYALNNPVIRIDPDGRVDVRTTEDTEITESPAVLAVSAELADSTSSGFEYGAVVGERNPGDFVATNILTDQHPGAVSLASAMEKDEQRQWVIRGTDIPAVRSVHTHLKPGVYPLPGGGAFQVRDNKNPSSPDRQSVKSTGVTGYILVPSAKLLIKVNPSGTYEKIRTKKDYKRWMKRAREERARRQTP